MKETFPIIDLILVHQPGGNTLTGMVQDAPESEMMMLGPVPASGGIAPLARALLAAVPSRFATLEAAESALVLIHFRNLHQGCNSAGQDSPFRIGGGRS
jgi:hypothetical protein